MGRSKVQFSLLLHFLHHEDDAVTLRVLELQLIFFLWSILGPSVPSRYNISMYTHQAHHLSNTFLLKDENYKKNRKIYGMKLKKWITYRMCLILISFYEWMLLWYNIPNRKGKIRGAPLKSYAIMTEISGERVLRILKKKSRFLCILDKKSA